ncbi:MAG TPA: hypothetical protein VFZ53_21885 [Polyangiaceae bacterium]
MPSGLDFRRPLRVFVALAALALAPAANAAEPFGIDSPTPSPPAPSGTDQAVVARYWELGRTRPFLAGTVDAGYPYFRPRFAAGYGRPFWSWLGVEVSPTLAFGGVGSYVGAAAVVPGLTLRGGGRYFFPFSRTLLSPREHFTRQDLELSEGPRGDYLSYEAEAAATAPLFSGSVFGVLTGYRISRVHPDYYLYEENLRSVMKPPYIWRARLGYLLAFSRNGAIRLGAAGELIGLPGREEFVVRAGLLGSVSISAELEAQVSLIPVLVSPDRLGLAGGDFGQLGVRYSFSTGSTPDPERLKEATRASESKRPSR